jgi:hypothetical protein
VAHWIACLEALVFVFGDRLVFDGIHGDGPQMLYEGLCHFRPQYSHEQYGSVRCH